MEIFMAFISLRQLLDHAAEYGYGVPAFNVNNLEQGDVNGQVASRLASPASSSAAAC
jgi:fructose-bisphosphate aldolase, class II